MISTHRFRRARLLRAPADTPAQRTGKILPGREELKPVPGRDGAAEAADSPLPAALQLSMVFQHNPASRREARGAERRSRRLRMVLGGSR